MHPRLEILQRLAGLYAVVEEMHAAQLELTVAAVHEAQLAIGSERKVANLARVDGHRALTHGDRLEWMVAETQQKTAARRQRQLEQMRVEREELKDAAREQYVASRLRKEQMKRVMEDIAERIKVDEGRRMQAISDDRFLARRRWTDQQSRIQDGAR